MRVSPASLMVVSLLTLLQAGALPAADSPTPKSDAGQGLSLSSREARAAALFRDREHGMVDDGTPKESIDAPASKGPTAPGPMNAPMAPSSSMDLGKFSRFLRQGIEQSRGQSYEAATKSLRTTLEAVYGVGNLPPGIVLCFRTSRTAADKASSWRKAYEITSETMKQVANDPQRWSLGGPEFARSFLHLGHGFSRGSSHEEACKLVEIYASALENSGLYHFEPMDRLILRSTREGVDKVSSWRKGYEVWSDTLKNFRANLGNNQVRDFYGLALSWSRGSSHEVATKVVWQSLRNLFAAGALDAFDKLTLETAIKQGEDASSWRKAYDLITSAIRSVI